MCLGGLPVCVSVHHLLQGARRRVFDLSGTEVTDGCGELLCGCWELNCGSLEE